MSEDNTTEDIALKNVLLSKGVIGGALAAISGILLFFGVDFTAEDAHNVGDSIDIILDRALAISAAVGGIVAVVGRVMASTKLTFPKIKFPWQKG